MKRKEAFRAPGYFAKKFPPKLLRLFRYRRMRDRCKPRIRKRLKHEKDYTTVRPIGVVSNGEANFFRSIMYGNMQRFNHPCQKM